jgi:hypothetical protein
MTKNQLNLVLEENRKILAAYEAWLSDKGLSEKTVAMHCGNIEFYINDFLLHDEPIPAREGIDRIGVFLGYWFIRKAMWASEASIRSNSTSLKKFCDFMQERGEVPAEEVREMKNQIKEELPEWIETVKRYDDLSIDIEDVWPL